MSDPAGSEPFPHDLESDLLRAMDGFGRGALVVPGPFGPYRLLRELGRGGMGCVYLAEHVQLGRHVALKLIQPELLGSRELRQRFGREVQAAARLDHPHLCRVYEAGEVDGRPYMAMQWIQGETLAVRIAGAQTQQRRVGRRQVAELVALFEQIAEAVHAAHGAGLIHRDLKPANLMLTEAGDPVVLDFGLARIEDGTEAGLSSLYGTPGTPLYMAPEQIEGKVGLDRRVDVYALGLVLYECLTLSRPFTAEPAHELQAQILTQEPPRPRARNRAIPADLEAVLECALAKNRDRRYATAAELADDLRRVRERVPVRARRTGLVLRAWRFAQRHPAVVSVMVVLLLALLVSGGFAWSMELAQRRERKAAAELASMTVRNAMEAGNWRLALEEMKRASSADNAVHRDLVFSRLLAQIGLGDLTAAKAEVARIESEGGADADPRLLLVTAELEDDPARARACLLRFVAESDAAEADLSYAQAMLAQGDEVDRLLDVALRADPRHLLANTQRVLSYAEHGDAAAAVELARRQQAMMPEAPLFQFAECLAMAQQGRFEDAERRVLQLGEAEGRPILTLASSVIRMLRAVDKFLELRTLALAWQVRSWGADAPGKLREAAVAVAIVVEVGRVFKSLVASGLPVKARAAVSGLVPPLPRTMTSAAVSEWVGRLPEARLRALTTMERYNSCKDDLDCLVGLARELLDSLDDPGFLRPLPAARRFVVASALLCLRGVFETRSDPPTQARAAAIDLLNRLVGLIAAGDLVDPPLAMMAGDAAIRSEHLGLQVSIGHALIRRHPESPWGPFLLARCEARSDRPDAARYWCRQVLAVDPQFGPALEYMEQSKVGK